MVLFIGGHLLWAVVLAGTAAAAAAAIFLRGRWWVGAWCVVFVLGADLVCSLIFWRLQARDARFEAAQAEAAEAFCRPPRCSKTAVCIDFS
jgi:Flp pilus assembly protein TadB